ncbi:TPA: hypothetical protein QDB15_000121 [Burkholderia vietnamiensis]|uniref:Uncharacterized protein n=1 Tax=Pandoraea apista TaxID=93218 RepID=A0A5E5P2D1_9BURK|nr:MULTISPECIES: hypothetical protein [Burkholderiaceae]MCA8206395.1 hypothetical protein [Burkholderia vietnamiensis]VVG70333.1 hypothetical protein PAP18089_01293 [Pandoraea apista]HDR8943193.1 hypothetical protein [Burkholderia vietnamiensis]HDR9116397.1 hypothetical protein [Burkholderia vietnamiensis]HDR9205443.1 hypothetical protein [Burkholderia vietnamiensis]
MDKKSLETAVGYAWDDLGTAAVLVKMAAQEYVDAAQETLAAFDDVQRQLTTIFMQNLSLEQASRLMAELRKQPAGQMTVAFAQDTQLQVKLKSANEAKVAYRDATQAWEEAVDAAEDAGCERTARFSAPDEVVPADQAIEAEAKITDKLNDLRAAIEKGAQHVDTIVQAAQSAPAAVVPSPVAPSVAAPVDPEVESAEDMLNGMTDNATAPAAEPTATQSVAPVAVDEPPVPAQPVEPQGPQPVNTAPEVPPVASSAEPAPQKPIPTSGVGLELVDAMISMSDAGRALNDFAGDDAEAYQTLMGNIRRAVEDLGAALAAYRQEETDPDTSLIENAEKLHGMFSGMLEVEALGERARAENRALDEAADAYNAANDVSDSNGRIRAQSNYRMAHERLARTFAELKAVDGMGMDADFLDAVASAVDNGGRNLAMMANRTHVAVTAREGIEAHDAAWGAKPASAGLAGLTSHIKPVVIGVAALLVIVAGVWIGSGSSNSDPIAAPAPVVAPPAPIAPPTVPAPAVPVVPVPAPVATPRVVAPAVPAALAAPVAHVAPVAPAPVVAKPAVAPTVHRPPVVHHVDNLAREQAQLNAANAKLDAWAQQHDHQP